MNRPSCFEKSCSGDPLIQHVVAGSCGSHTQSRHLCTFECDVGYTPSSPATCLRGHFQTGPWCKPNACSNDPGISLSSSRCSSHDHDSTCVPSCASGYVLSPSSVTCVLGTWTDATCVCLCLSDRGALLHILLHTSIIRVSYSEFRVPKNSFKFLLPKSGEHTTRVSDQKSQFQRFCVNEKSNSV